MADQHNERGQATAIIVLFLGMVMLGFLGFALDVGYYFHEKRMAQAAADAAAMAAAEEDGYGNTSNAQAVANQAATMNGFDTTLASNPAVVTLTKQTAGPYASSGTTNSTWMQAVVTQPIKGIFLSAFNHTSTTMTIAATAVAGEGQASQTCVCLEGSSGQDLTLSNGTAMTANGCAIMLNSSSSNAASVVGGSVLTASTLASISPNWDTSANVNNGGSISSGTKVVQGLSNSCTPSMPAAPVDTSCSADPLTKVSNGGSSYTVGPGSTYGTTVNGNTICYTSLTLGANGDSVTINPGIYVINGGSLHFESGGNKGGSGVVFYLENGASVTLDNGANISVSAPTSGTYNGILIYQDASDSNAISLQGGSGSTMAGAIYAPAATLTIGNGSASAVQSTIVANALNLTGGGTLKVSATTNIGSLSSSGARLVQ